MFPNMPPNSMTPNAEPPMAPSQEPQPNSQEDTALVEKQIEAILRKAKQIADANGVNFNEIVSKLESGRPSMTKPPMPPSRQSPLAKA